ncbi:SMP-30/gluconolactonase/LRE family protein [Gilvimarinus sp. SDUM040013]|uniref:SMP-30/gluconolactonase/LRE family protein n=1 Tax=Gilvimarinus gilvus TaxID=3058038 RepID=A0ABU4RXZ3_9GAMM|nr:SMP-30/gluconolactonase/LRE family protein [Gilvimarinus sp. SDUM040013]MDO3388605.1 SMP-30/gluconolactonase/LRE family protein [Gilvimarinus sp. SDUM040013]MDX6848523.1 SMP-30/gluconolactonase/LRE family protein [Gilvimarinus sp. SDUM040013]
MKLEKSKRLSSSFLLCLGLTACGHVSAVDTIDWVEENTFTQGIEGPVVGEDGHLYAVNFQREGTIGQITGQNQASLWLALPEGSTGNALRIAPNGNMYVADYTGHNILSIDTTTKEVEVFAHNNQMNQPNDIAISAAGIVFASDPNWAESTGNLWRADSKGKTTLLESNMGTTNGIELAPDGKTLYVNESVQRKVWAYDLDDQGNISNKREFYSFDNHGMDGMACDIEGNLYIARYGAGTIAVLSPKGELIKTIALNGKHPTNIAFGGEDNKRAFITMQKRGNVESFVNDIPGYK